MLRDPVPQLLAGTVDMCAGGTPSGCDSVLFSAALYGGYLLWEMTMHARNRVAAALTVHHFMTVVWVVSVLSTQYVPRTPVLVFTLLILNQLTPLTQYLRCHCAHLEREIYAMSLANYWASGLVLVLNVAGNGLFLINAAYAGRVSEAAYMLAFLLPILNGQRHTVRALGERTAKQRARFGHMGASHVAAVLSCVAREAALAVTVAPLLVLLYRPLARWFFAKGTHSSTAAGLANLRALAHADRNPHLHVNDPYAVGFIKSYARLLLRSTTLRGLVMIGLERRHPGAFAHAVTRTKQIDEQLEDLVRHRNVRQLVILGAGYDMRAWRLACLRECGVRVLELDQPELSAVKQRAVAALGDGASCAPHHFVPIDFNTQRISDALLSSPHFDRKCATFYLWEGVQVYLPIETVKATFGEVARVGAVQAAAYLWLTFSDLAALRGGTLYGAAQFCEYARRMGESAVSGIDPAALHEFVRQLGFALVDGVGAFPGHMTPDAKNARFLQDGHFVRASEVFHNALCKVVTADCLEEVSPSRWPAEMTAAGLNDLKARALDTPSPRDRSRSAPFGVVRPGPDFMFM